jgi:hypothetical protein
VYKNPKPTYNEPAEFHPYRTDIVRVSNRYDDLANQVVVTYKTYAEIESKTSSLVARNSDNTGFFLTKDWLDDMVGKNRYGMNSVMYRRLLESVEKFYLKNKSTKRLPIPHVISHRSAHFGEGLFAVTQVDHEKYLEATKSRVRNFKVSSVHKLEIDGLGPFYIENMRTGSYKYLIVRPKLGKSGAPMPDRWEVLLFTENLGYNVSHIDTEKNPRYNGSIL